MQEVTGSTPVFSPRRATCTGWPFSLVPRHLPACQLRTCPSWNTVPSSSSSTPRTWSPGSTTAFLHALRIATTTRSRLTIMHVAEDEDMNWSELPGCVPRWPAGPDAGAEDMDGLMRLGVGVKKVVTEGGDPAKACTEYLEKHPPLTSIVLSTHQHGGRMGWLKRRVAELLSRDARPPCSCRTNGRASWTRTPGR